MLEITKEKSVIHKGLAILMMIYSHVFFADSASLYCVNSFYINGEPLAKFLTFACNPVPYFLLLSGYGHAACYYTKGLSFKSEFYRILRLYIYYWVVLLFFLMVGHYYSPDNYPGSLSRFIWGVSALCPYIGALWFLLPFACIALCSKYIIIAVEKILFNLLSIKGIAKKLLLNLGERSMPMWMIHTIFCSYFFREQLYSLKYPILVYIVLILISYFLSLFVDKIVNFLYRLKNRCYYAYEKY